MTVGRFGKWWSVAVRFVFLALVLSYPSLAAAAPQPYVVKDINSFPAGSDPSSLSSMTYINGVLYFVATDSVHGSELWKSDGTAGGTVLVKDINPGSSSSGPAFLTNLNGVLYFQAYDPTNTYGLWKSDGTALGTELVKGFPGTSSSSGLYLTIFKGSLYFWASDPTSGSELWKSDGTTIGTMLVKDIYPGPSSSDPSYLTIVKDVLYFSANGGLSGKELWKSDGTAAGTVMVKDINSGMSGSYPLYLKNVNDVLYFSATDPTNGAELWKSDGTDAGTVLVKDIYSGGSSSYPNNLTNCNSKLYFTASNSTNGNELWMSDGTNAGTVLVKDINTGNGGSSPVYLTDVNDALYFRAYNSTNGSELWKSDGTDAGTVLVKDIYPGIGSSSPISMTNVSGVVYFAATDGTNGSEFWKSDGTATGTVLVKDINPGSGSSSLKNLTNVNGVLYFRANDSTNGIEFWKSDGTPGGTVLVKDINLGTESSIPISLTNVNGTLYFQATDGTNGNELWKSNGTAGGTTMVKDIYPGPNGSNVNSLTNVNGMLYFEATNGVNGNELWKSNGTAGGTVMVTDINPGSTSTDLQWLTDVDGVLFFVANDPVNGYELWKVYGGTSAGLVKDIYAGSGSSGPVFLTNVKGFLYFVAADPTNGYELWKSDGTVGGTVLVKDICPGPCSFFPESLTNVNGVLYFKATDPYYGTELWTSDGTASGTVQVLDIFSGSGGSSPANLINFNNKLYFTATDIWYGTELWQSDGTIYGTFPVLDINPGTAGSSPAELTIVNDMLYFVATDVWNGRELWKSNGVFNGTELVKDINPGTGDTSLESLTNLNGVLYFVATNGTNGTELWKSDGTSGGTVLVKDISPGAGSSYPASLTNVNGVLYFEATDAWLGRELFALNTTVTADITPPVTDASPAAGAFSSPQNVSLNCSDTGGSGCAGIFYTLDGSQPTVYSRPYQALISISSTTTLKYFAIDVAGNQETVHSGTYTIDTVAPAISILNPGTAPAQTKTVTATVADALDPAPTLAMTAGSTSSVCDGTRTFITYAPTTFTSEADNGRMICFRGMDWAGNTTYVLSAAISGIDTISPTVTIDQDSGQADPTAGTQIIFRVVFSEPVSDFATGDVTITGTAAGTKTATVSGSGTTYSVAVTGMTGSGTVVASIAADVAGDAAGNLNAASTSTDNVVTFDNHQPQSITVTVQAPANAAYGSSFPVAASASSGLLVAITSSGACSGSGLAVATITMTSGAGTCTLAYNQGGSDTYWPAAAVLENCKAQPAAITVTAAPKSKIYGAADPELTFTVTNGGLVGTDGFSGALSRDPGEDAGAYPIRQGTLSAGGNYNLTYVGADLTITPAAQTITVAPHAPASAIHGDSFTVAATASSGSDVAITSSGACSGGGLGSAAITMTNGAGTCTVAYNQSGNDNYNAAPQVVEEVAAKENNLPTLDAIGDLAVNEDAMGQTVNLAGIGAGPGESQTLTVTATSSNGGLIPNPTVTYTSPDATGSLSFTPAANLSGSATITVTINDAHPVNNTYARTFTLTVNPVNDAPSFMKGGDQTAVEGTGTQTVPIWATAISAGPPDESDQTLMFTAANNNNALFLAQPALAPDGTLTYTPAADAGGSATVTVTLGDSGGTANGGVDTSAAQTFQITVLPDINAPYSTIGDPVTGASFMATVYRISGSAGDTGSGVDKVDISIDGDSWLPATGTTFWYYDWAVPSDGSFTIRTRATDKSGNIETPGAGVTVTAYRRQPSAFTVSGRQLLLDGNPFTIRGVVYSPVPIGVDPETMAPYGDYFTSEYAPIHDRDLELLRQMGANAVLIPSFGYTAEHHAFLDKAYNGGVNPVYVVAGFRIDAGLDIDPASPVNVREQLKADFVSMVATHRSHPAILLWAIGSDLNAPEMYGGDLGNLFSLIDEMAQVAHSAEEGAGHPLTAGLADTDLTGTIAAYDGLVPNIDLWGAAVSRGNTFGTLFADYAAASSRPLVLLGYGIDAFDNAFGDEYENLGAPLQGDYAAALWGEIAANADSCAGGLVTEYSDEWWRGKQSAPAAGCPDADPALHSACGQDDAAEPDGFLNEEWRGLVRMADNGDNPDLAEPRAAYYALQSLWAPPPPEADLSVAVTDAPDPIFGGGNLTYTITVTNGGPDSATGVTLSETLPPGVTFVSATASRGSCTAAALSVTCDLGSVALSQSVTVTTVVKTPASAQILTNSVSAAALEQDPDTTNNTATTTTTVLPAGIDLVETAISNPPATVVWGGKFNVTDTTRNQGGTSTGKTTTTTRYYLSRDTLKNTGDLLLSGARNVPALASMASSTGTVQVTVGSTAAVGSYYLLACADDQLKVAEADETNNCIASATVLVVTAPDLVESAVTPSTTSARIGKSFSVTDTLTNQGDAATTKSVTTRFYLSLDTTKGSSDKLLNGTRNTAAPLNPGAATTGTTTVTIPTTTSAGTYYVLGCADDTTVQPESLETNNCAASATRVTVSR